MSEIMEFTERIGLNAVTQAHLGLIVDIVLCLIFLLFALWYARRGFCKVFAGLIVFVLAIALGIAGANMLTEPAMEKVWPKVEATVEEHYDASVGSAITELQESVGGMAEKLLQITHLEESAEDILDSQAFVSSVSFPKERLLELVHKALREIVHAALFVVIAILGLMLGKPITYIIGKINDAPVLKQLDWLGGFLVGLLVCLAVLFLVVKGCELRNVAFLREIQAESWIIAKLLGQ